MKPKVITNLQPPPTPPRIYQPPVRSVRPLEPAVTVGFGVAVSLSTVERVLSGSTSTVTREDRFENQGGDVILVRDVQVNVVRTGSQSAPINYTSQHPSVATANGAGLISYVGNGSARIRIAHGGYFVDFWVRMASYSTPSTVYLSGIAGSVRAHAEGQVDGLLLDAAPAAALRFFTNQNHGGASYVRNVNCWAQGLAGVTGISPWNSTGANKRGGVALTARHVLFAKHFQIGTGAAVRFVAADNTVVNRVLAGKESLAGTDLVVGLLDADLPASIERVKVLPVNWEDYFSTGLEFLPALCLDQEEKALVTDVRATGDLIHFKVPLEGKRLEFYEPKISGDSGNPAFLVIGGELVLLTTWWYGGAGSGPFVARWRAEIEAAMVSLGAHGHSLADVDLSGFTDFS